MSKEEIKNDLSRIDSAIKRHRELAMWGNVESKERLKFLHMRKKHLKNELLLQ